MTTLVVISDMDLEIGNETDATLHCPEASAAEVAAGLITKDVNTPLILLATTNRAQWLPAIARSQRAQGRKISGYLVIDPAEIFVSDAWPDAPVIALVSGTAEQSGNLARLRGWRVVPYEMNSLAETLASALKYFD